MTAVEVAFSLGSNIGDKAAILRRALRALEEAGAVTGLQSSHLYRTAPWGHVTDQDWFLNLCAVGRTVLAPHALLAACKAIEAQLGRTDTIRWGPRVIDIDILFYGDVALDAPDLCLPHREILNRAFVLVPLAELRPDLVIGGIAVADAAAALDTRDVVRFDPPS